VNKDLNEYVNHVEGENRGHVLVYALSSCAWCRKAKNLLDSMGVEYYYIDADRVEEKDRQRLMETVEKWNPSCIFPTVVINEDTCISGDELRMREILGRQLQ
jgi:glutaredoxin-like protein NrdH